MNTLFIKKEHFTRSDTQKKIFQIYTNKNKTLINMNKTYRK